MHGVLLLLGDLGPKWADPSHPPSWHFLPLVAIRAHTGPWNFYTCPLFYTPCASAFSPAPINTGTQPLPLWSFHSGASSSWKTDPTSPTLRSEAEYRAIPTHPTNCRNLSPDCGVQSPSSENWKYPPVECQVHVGRDISVLFPNVSSEPGTALSTGPLGVCWMNETFQAAIVLLSMCTNEPVTCVHRLMCTRTRGANNWEKLMFINWQWLMLGKWIMGVWNRAATKQETD